MFRSTPMSLMTLFAADRVFASGYGNLRVAAVLLVLIGVGNSASAGQDSPVFEFCDDFGKPAHYQRDPSEERIETERHDFTQSAITVGRGVVQIEAGYSYFRKETDSEKESAHTGPEVLLRIGLSEDIEVRLRWNHAWVFVEEERDRIGSEDLRYSIKLQMTRQEEPSWIPTSALELRGSAPTGGSAFTTEDIEFSLDYIYLWEIAEFISLAGSTGLGANGFGDFGLVPDQPTAEDFDVISQSAVIGMELTEANTFYAEWYGIFSSGLVDEFSVSVFNVGLDHYLTDDLVIDLRVGAGLTDDSDDFFVGVGGGYRF